MNILPTLQNYALSYVGNLYVRLTARHRHCPLTMLSCRILLESPLFRVIRDAHSGCLTSKVVVIEGDLIPADLTQLVESAPEARTGMAVKEPLSSNSNSDATDTPMTPRFSHKVISQSSIPTPSLVAAANIPVHLLKHNKADKAPPANGASRLPTSRSPHPERCFNLLRGRSLLGTCFKGFTGCRSSDSAALGHGNSATPPKQIGIPNDPLPSLPCRPLQNCLGLSEGDKVNELLATTTHVIHCAAK